MRARVSGGQRRMIEAQLAEGLADIEGGRTCGPFNSTDEMIAHMKSLLGKKIAITQELNALDEGRLLRTCR
jgi:hypothetical protein